MSTRPSKQLSRPLRSPPAPHQGRLQAEATLKHVRSQVLARTDPADTAAGLGVDRLGGTPAALCVVVGEKGATSTALGTAADVACVRGTARQPRRPVQPAAPGLLLPCSVSLFLPLTPGFQERGSLCPGSVTNIAPHCIRGWQIFPYSDSREQSRPVGCSPWRQLRPALAVG